MDRSRGGDGEIQDMDRSCILCTENLSAGYRGRAVVSDVNFSLQRGEIIALIGPNGTGKSTILKTVSGQLAPLSGTVYVGGKDLCMLTEKERARAMSLMMTERVNPELMTCSDVISLGRYPYTGITGRLDDHDREVIRQSMQMANVTELADRFFNEISDGQKQRVLLARAICQEPKVLIMDEPTSFLDIRYKLELLQVLRKLVKERNVAVLISIHEIELAEKAADAVICVRDGKAWLEKDVEAVFTEENIRKLFDISREQYRWLYGENR